MNEQPLSFIRLAEANKIADSKDQVLYGQSYAFLESVHNRGLIIPEMIFGSGFDQHQNAELAQLELLTILDYFYKHKENLVTELTEHGAIKYQASKQLLLRALIFNNYSIEYFNNNNNYTEEQKWNYWLEFFQQTNLEIEYIADKKRAIEKKPLEDRTPDELEVLTDCTNTYNYLNFLFKHETVKALRQKFNNFAEFTSFICLLRQMYVFTPQKTNIWLYSFLFPLGNNALFIELRRDYSTSQNYIAGVGSTLFNMIFRTEHGKEILDKLYQRFLIEADPLNNVLELLSDSQNEPPCNTNTKYLPLHNHFAYEQLVEDISALLQLNLAKEELFYALSRICYLNLLIYFFDRMCTVCTKNNNHKEFAFFINVDNNTNPKNIAIANTSCLSFTRNKTLLKESVFQYVQTRLYNFLHEYDHSLVQEALTLKQCEYLCSIVPYAFKSAFFNQIEEGALPNHKLTSYVFKFNEHIDNELSLKYQEKVVRFDSIINEICNTILKNGNYNGCPSLYASAIGLKPNSPHSKHYILSDALLQNLAMIIIPAKDKYMTLPEFLKRIKQRYHIEIDSKDFMQESNIHKDQLTINRDNFIKQLNRNNLLVKLSDNSNSYIRNPYC